MNNDNEEKIKINKKTFTISIIVGLIVFIVVFITMCSIIPNSDNGDSPSDSNPNIQNYYYEINETATYEGLNITINSFEFTDFFCGIEPSSTTNDTLCVVNVTLKNPTSKTIHLTETFLTYTSYEYTYKLVYDESITYYQTWIDSYTDFINTHDEIRPLQTITASVCYKIPKEIKNSSKKLELKFSLNQTDASEFHIWTLRSN